MKEKSSLKEVNRIIDRIEKNINKLMEYEAMKCSNEEKMWRGEEPTYSRKDFLKLFGHD